MITSIKRKSLFSSLLLLAACASQPDEPNSLSPAAIVPRQPVNIGAVVSRETIAREKAELTAAFYSDIPDCESGPFSLRDLMIGDVQLSNTDVTSVASTLNIMGYRVVNLQQAAGSQASNFSCDELPVVVVQSQPSNLKLSFDPLHATQIGSTTVKPLAKSNAAEIDRLLVYYHPSRADEYEKLSWLVADKLDVPAAQVYIETMVLEVREEDSKEFGIDYQKADGDKLWSLGSLVPGASDTANFVRNTLTDPESGLNIFTPGFGKQVRIRALIDEGKAEVLSRPSILALSNRQAVIQVVDVIQTADLSSTLSSSGDLQISSYNFTPLLIGITLNLRPRVSADRKWLTLEIDATVEAEDDENNGEVFALTESGESVLLAEKQGSNSKKVKTFARIPDRTPIIIGGLVGNKMEEAESKIPLLGNIPGLGKLFTSVDKEIQKREIIIVLTPYILAEESNSITSNQPNAEVLERNNSALLFGREQ